MYKCRMLLLGAYQKVIQGFFLSASEAGIKGELYHCPAEAGFIYVALTNLVL